MLNLLQVILSLGSLDSFPKAWWIGMHETFHQGFLQLNFLPGSVHISSGAWLSCYLVVVFDIWPQDAGIVGFCDRSLIIVPRYKRPSHAPLHRHCAPILSKNHKIALNFSLKAYFCWCTNYLILSSLASLCSVSLPPRARVILFCYDYVSLPVTRQELRRGGLVTRDITSA